VSRFEGFGGCIDAPGVEVFDAGLAFEDGRGQGDAAANDERLFQLEDDDGEAGFMQSVGDAGGQVAAAAKEDKVVGK
jgi:hypothetical protein